MNINTPSNQKLTSLALSAIGIVFGDIGTSPLYAFKECFTDGLPTDSFHVFGVLSLIFWSLSLVVAIKYAIFIMRADNNGEGGIMALLALTTRVCENKPRLMRVVIIIGLVGASLFYGDSMITPAISVLSAVEGLEIVEPQLQHYILPITLIVLLGLFLMQSKGTHTIGKIFSPVMCLWFCVIAMMGLGNIIQAPAVLQAINPYYGLQLLWELGWKGFFIMGSVVLAITGAEALYADMGHFGLKPIRYAWFGFVFPALLLNYFGQGALVLSHPEALQNPFYLLAPQWALYPLLILATIATVIASQAVISGAFSLTRQAIQLGYCPRMAIFHTSDDEIGQVYLPTVNWLLMVSVFVVVLSFPSSSSLASAYGIAVTGTMLTTTLLAFIVIQSLWRWKLFYSLVFLVGFLSLDVTFLTANVPKIPTGGWLPLTVATVLFLIMTTWIKGRELMTAYQSKQALSFENLETDIERRPPAIIEGTAIYMTRGLHGVPQVFQHNFKHNHVLHQQVIVLTVVTKDEPYVDEERRIKIRSYGSNGRFYRVKLYFGFKQNQDVRRALQLCKQQGLSINEERVSFFIGREFITFQHNSPMANWRRPLFRFLFHNATSAIVFFKIPVDWVAELGVRYEL